MPSARVDTARRLEAAKQPLAARGEGDARPLDEVVRGRGHEHLSAVRLGGDSRREMDRDPAHGVLLALDLARVDAHADSELERYEAVAQVETAADRTRRPVEEREDPVSRRVDELAAVLRQNVGDDPVVGGQAFRPGPVTQPARQLGRADDIAEEDASEHPAGPARGRAPVTNSSTSSTIWSGSIETKWSTPGSSTNVAPGIRSPRYRPPSIGASGSPVRWRTSVRTCTAGETSRTSICEFIRIRSRAAPGLAAARARSPHHWAIASSAFGHIWRMSASQPHSRSIWSA